jgi:oligopeptide/dipeptide ABC transporter ATP-binding protein
MLLDAIPRARVPTQARQRGGQTAMGEIPSPINPPTGCAFHPRCKYKQPICASVYPETREIAPGHSASCHLL